MGSFKRFTAQLSFLGALTLLGAGSVFANTIMLPAEHNRLSNSCSWNASTQVINCNGNISNFNDTVTIRLTEDVTLNSNHGLTFNGSQSVVNPDGQFTFNINITGNNNAISVNGSGIEINANLSMTGTPNLSAGTLINGSVTLSSSNDFNVNQSVIINGDIDVQGTINNNGTINGNVTTPRELRNNSQGSISGRVVTGGSMTNNSVINGSVQVGGALANNGGGEIYGNACVAGSATINGNSRVLLNLTANGSVVVNGGGRAGSINARGVVQNNGVVDEYIRAPAISGSGSHGSTQISNNLDWQCPGTAGSGGSGGTQSDPTSFCDALTDLTGIGIFAANGIFYQTTGAATPTMNGTRLNGSGNSINPNNAQLGYIYPSLPAFEPSTFQTNPTGGNGTYHGKLVLNQQSYTFNAGDHFITELELGNHVTIKTNGPVRLFVRDSIIAKNGFAFNPSGPTGNLQIFLYDGASVTLKNTGNPHQGVDFNGFLYGPHSNNNVEFKNNANVYGSIIVGGTLRMKRNIDFYYNSNMRGEIDNALGCSESTGVDHLRMIHPQSVVACFAAPVELIACANEDCTTTVNDELSFAVAASAANSAWSGESITETSNGAASITMSGGSTMLGLSRVSGGSTTLSSDDFSVRCFDQNETETNCGVEFRQSGLVIGGDSLREGVPNSFAGDTVPSSIWAVETDDTTGACHARVSGTQTVNIGVQCIDPVACADNVSYRLNGQSVARNNASTGAISYSAIELTFDESGRASFEHQYNDVGMFRMHASMSVDASDGENEGVSDPSITLTGTSLNDYVFKPYRLVVLPLTDSGAIWEDVTEPFKPAGEEFSVIVQAQTADGTPTPNFGNETTPIQVRASGDSVAYPAEHGFVGIVEGLNTFSYAANHPGAMIAERVTWSEVGILSATAKILGNNYLGAGDVAEHQPHPIGRFYPASFRLRPNLSSVLNGLGTGDSAFTYMGQPNISVQYTLQALNAVGQVTRNYGQGYADRAQVRLTAGLLGSDGNLTDLTSRIGTLGESGVTPARSDNWVNGELKFSGNNLVFGRLPSNTPDGPFEDVRLGVVVEQERDNVDFAGGDKTLGQAVPLPDSLRLRYGRMVLENVYGPAGSDLPVAARAEYWSSTTNRWRLNIHDSGTLLNYANLNIISDAEGIDPQKGGVVGNLSSGQTQGNELMWKDPQEVGEVLFEYQAPPWLQVPWVDGEGNQFDNPRGYAGFGIYRGNDRVLFWLELR